MISICILPLNRMIFRTCEERKQEGRALALPAAAALGAREARGALAEGHAGSELLAHAVAAALARVFAKA